MTFADFYLICFIVGCVLSVLSFLCGAFHLHLPGGLHHVVHCGGGHDFSHHGGSEPQASRFNLPTVMVFLAWFGGAGYLVTNMYGLGFLIVLGIACFSGLIGGSIAFWFLAKVLMGRDLAMKESDYRMTGMLATVNSPIRKGRTGEIVYSHGGARKVSGARSEDGEEIDRGEEVVVIRFEKGIALVRRWTEIESR
jgi:membrane protein implicated in regulation of membrane protease activity